MIEAQEWNAGVRRNVHGFKHVAPIVWVGDGHTIYSVPEGFQVWREHPTAKPIGVYPTLHRAAQAARSSAAPIISNYFPRDTLSPRG